MGKLGVGEHEVTIVGTSIGTNQGNDQLTIVIEFSDERGDRINVTKYTTDAAWAYTEKDLKTCGWDAEANGYQFEQLAQSNSPILGNRVRITVDEQEYKGKPQLRVKWINAIRNTDPAQVSSLAAQLRARLMGRAGKPVDLPAGEPESLPTDKVPW